jgi:hypothetical protein
LVVKRYNSYPEDACYDDKYGAWVSEYRG